MKRWIHAATEHEDFVVDSDLSSYLDQKEAKRQKSHEKYIARRSAIRRAAARAFKAEEDTPKNQQEAKDLYNKYKDGAVTASTDTKSRIAQLEEQIEWLKNDISSLNEMLADPNIPRYNDESDEDLEDRIADRQQELADAEEQLNFAWQDDEAEYNYALEQQEFNPDGSLALYGATITGSADDKGYFDVDGVKAYLKENLNGKIDSIITFTDGGFYDLEKQGISGVGVWVGYQHKGSASSKAREKVLRNSMYHVENAFAEYLEYEGIDPDSMEVDNYLSSMDMFRIWAPYDSTTVNASTNIEASSIAPSGKIQKGMQWNRDWHDFTVDSIAPDHKTCKITEEWINEDTGKEMKQIRTYRIVNDNGVEFVYNPKYESYLSDEDYAPLFKMYADGANNYPIDWDAAQKRLDEKYTEARERNNGENSKWSPDTDPEYESQDKELMSRYDDDYTPSATAGDYSPSNPWDAPGMGISDFI